MNQISRIDLPLPLSNYYRELNRDLGIGGFARVFLAKHIETDVKVAIKAIRKELSKSEMFRIKEEIGIMQKLNHQNICKLYQVLETDEYVFMVLEYISGGELYDQIVNNSRMSEKEARRIFRQVLSAVGYIHSCGIAHRDLKPENILIDELKNIRIIDFGLSACPTGGLINPLNTLCGSVAYAAPELLSGKAYLGNEVDIWSMGVLLFTLLCGYLPFDNDTSIQTALNNIQKGVFQFSNGLSREAKDIICHMLEPDPKKRLNIWALANHEWVLKGYGTSVSWGILSDRTYINQEYVRILTKRYGEPIEVVEKMIHENSLNEISAHYGFLKAASMKNEFSLKKHKSSPNILQMDVAKKIKLHERNINHENMHLGSGKTDEMYDPSFNKFPSVHKSSDIILNDSTNKSKSTNFIGRIAELFTSKRFNQSNIPRTLKPAGNIRIVNACSGSTLQSIFDTTLVDMKNRGSLLSVKFENYIYKCEKLYAKRQKLVFTLEICNVSSLNQLQCGVLTKRIRGDSWEYKQALEEIIQTLFINHGIHM